MVDEQRIAVHLRQIRSNHSNLVVVIMKRLTSILLLVVALCGFGGVASGPDPFFIPDVSQIYPACTGTWKCNAPYTAQGKTVRNLAINTGIRNLVLFVMGQSNNINGAPSAYTPTNGSAIDDFNVYDGVIYASSDPHPGASWNSGIGAGGLMDFRVADALISNGKFDRVILVPMAIGGTNALQWANGGVIQNLPCIAMKRLAVRGITPTTNVTFAVDWGQGEAEIALGTSQSTYQTAITQIATNLDACGFSGRFFVNVQTWGGGITYAPVAAAQAAVAGTTVGNVAIKAGANLDSLNNTNRVDTTHFNDTGSAAGAALKVTAFAASGAPF
jgi:hypothetical protein